MLSHRFSYTYFYYTASKYISMCRKQMTAFLRMSTLYVGHCLIQNIIRFTGGRTKALHAYGPRCSDASPPQRICHVARNEKLIKPRVSQTHVQHLVICCMRRVSVNGEIEAE